MQMPPITKELLQLRDIPESTWQEFLSPDYAKLHDPFLLPDMEKTIVRLEQAVKNGERVWVYSDYDCDGIPGAVILTDLFSKIGFTNYRLYIPDRHDEGYGLNIPALDEAKADGATLLITIDLGIAAVAEVAYANSLGIEVIVTDHHEPVMNADGEHALPSAFAIVNHKRPDSQYPESILCGAGTIWKVVCAFVSRYGTEYGIEAGWEKWLLDMAGLATLSDMVPLVGENRIIATYGLLVMSKTRRPGLSALYVHAGIIPQYIQEDDVTFLITPKINAASRLGDAMHAFSLLSTKDRGQGQAYADALSKLNDSRKKLVAQAMKEAYAQLEGVEIGNIIVVGSVAWRPGILGLIAGKLTDQYKKTVFVWGGDPESEVLKGSCRGVEGVHVVRLMEATRESFTTFGGHEGAGGFALEKSAVHTLSTSLNTVYQEVIVEEKSIAYDKELTVQEVTRENWRGISILAPFGVGNHKPVFVFRAVTIFAAKNFGKEKNHLEITIEQGGSRVKAIAFFKTTEDYSVTVGSTHDVYGTFELSRFAGREELRLRIVDIV